MDAAPIPIDTLLAHREWVRAVARATGEASRGAEPHVHATRAWCRSMEKSADA